MSLNMSSHGAAFIKKVALWIIILYAAMAVAFYFLAGEQLRLRSSRGNLSMPPATSGTVELVSGNCVEQEFKVKIQRLENISVQWGTYYRKNSGTVRIELFDMRNSSLLMSQELDAAEISEGYVSTMTAKEPIEGIYLAPLLLRITSPDGLSGNAVSPMMNSEYSKEGFKIRLNGADSTGMLCFSATGEDYIWTGLHYWKFVAVFGLLLLFVLAIEIKRVKNNRPGVLFKAVLAINKYQFLVQQLVSRDFKTKYKRSFLGVLWSFLNPLLTMTVQYLVFSNLFRFDIPNYSVYLLCGIVLFNFFSESCSMTLLSVVGNASLISKVYVPKYIYPLTRTISSLINFLISLIPLFAVTLISGVYPTKAWLLLPFVVVCLTVFALGIGMLLATAMVFFRDTQFLWGVLSMIWMYLTPLFYPESILPNNIAWILKFNPLYYFTKFARMLLIDGISPEPIMYFQCFLFAVGALAVGAYVFKKNQDKFVLYL